MLFRNLQIRMKQNPKYYYNYEYNELKNIKKSLKIPKG